MIALAAQDPAEALPLPSPTRLAWAVLVLIGLCYPTFGALAQLLLGPPLGLWFTEVFILLGIPWALARASGRRPAAYARLRFPGALPLLLGFAFGVINYFALVVPVQALALRLSPEWLKALAPDGTRVFEHQSPWELCLVLGAVSIAAPVCEEFAFRGVLQQGLWARSLSAWRPIAVTAVLFSAFHLDPVGFWARVELGVLFGWLFVRSGTLWTDICAHAGNNVITTAAYLLLRGTAPQEPELPVGQAFLFAVPWALGLMGLLWLVRRYPALLAGRPARLGAQGGALSPEPPSRAAAPWVLGALASALLVAAVDHRGVALNVADLKYPLPEDEEVESGPLKERWDALYELRRRVRAGGAPLADYERRRRELAELLHRAPRKGSRKPRSGAVKARPTTGPPHAPPEGAPG